MTRWVCVLDVPPAWSPPGVPRERWADALLEDSSDAAAALDRVQVAVLTTPARRAAVEALLWPGTPVWTAPAPGADAAWLAAAADGAESAVLVAGDAPDLPGLLVGKLFRALGRADVAVCPAEGGGLVAAGVRLPAAGWLDGAVDLDAPDALDRLATAAPSRRALGTGPGWHRLRGPADLARLDPGLEGWPVTRLLLTGRRPPATS